jgi:geranylgeranyl reductase family protein
LNQYDVLVIGAWPAGLSAARRGAESGSRVAVLEEHEQVGDPLNSSGIVGLEAFERFDLPGSLARHTLSEIEFVSHRGRRWAFVCDRPLARVVLRSELDAHLGERAVAAGAEIRLRQRAVAVQRTEEGVRVTVKGSPDEDPLSCRALIVATGAGMPLLKKLGFDEIGETLLGVQTELEFAAERVEVHLGRQWAPEGFAWVVPVGSGRSKIGLLCDRDGPAMLRRFLSRPDIADRIRGPLGPIRCSVLPLGFLPRSYEDRVVVVGEAAGHIKATTCGGIYYGMLTGEIAGDVLEGCLAADRLDARSLSAYERRWRDLLEEEIASGLKLRKSVKLAGDWGVERLMDLARASGFERLIREKADFDWHRDLIGEVFRHATLGRLLHRGGAGAFGPRRSLREYSPV